MARNSNRRGFTLGEVLITVAIISVLAAVVIPSIAGQVTKGDLNRASSDMIALRNATEQYLSDIHRYPNSLGQLTNKPASGAAILGSSATLTAAEVNRWRGPYVSKDSAAGDSTAFGLAFASVSPFDTLTLPKSGTVRGAGIKYVVITIPSMDTSTAVSLDAAMDDGNTQTGLIRWIKKTSGADTLKFLMIPFQP